MSDLEITALVLSEHEAFRREFAGLEGHEGDLLQAWAALAARLEVHAVAEERLFYPVLAQQADDGVAEGERAVHDHNAIRHAAAAVDEHEVGSPGWWDAVRQAQDVNAEHMAQEERDFIPDFTASVDADERGELGLRWLQLHDEHEGGAGLSGEDADPAEVVGGAG